MISAQMPLKAAAKAALSSSFGLGPHSRSRCGGQDLLQFYTVIVKFLRSYFEMTNPNMRVVFLLFKTLFKVMVRRELMRSDVDCGLLLTACASREEGSPGLGAVRGVFKHKMVLLQFRGNMETWRENSFSWSILFSLPFSQHPCFGFPLTALQGEAVVSAVKERKGEPGRLIVEGFRRWLSLAFTSLLSWRFVCLRYGPSQEVGLEAAAPELGPLQPFARNA